MNDSIKISKEVIVENRIQEYLRVLPKGTEVISTRECTITGLSLLYEVVFYNPLMKSIKEVKIDHIRHSDLIDGHIEEMNLLASVEYIKRDGTTLGR